MNITVHSPNDIIPLLQKYTKYRQEHFGLICLDSERNVIYNKDLFIGSEHGTAVDPKIIFWKACEKKASTIIVFHNHPNQKTEPSDVDIKTTKKLLKASKLIGIQLLDHIIVGKYDYFSFLEHDLITNTKVKVRQKL